MEKKEVSMRYKVLISLLFLFFVLPTLKSQSASFVMETDRNEIEEGETFVLNIALENIDGRSLQLPDLSSFKIVQGPSTSSSITIINGKRSATQSYQYILLALKRGKYTILPASVKLGSKILKSNSLDITITEGKPNASPSQSLPDETSFIRLETESEEVYTGQQVVLNLVLYTRQNIQSYQMLNEPEFDGFFAQPINDIRDQPQRKTVQGKEYLTQIIRRWSLYPQKTGKYVLGPINCNFDVVDNNSQSSFFFRDTKSITVLSNKLNLKVLNLPTTSVASFSGGVGVFTMTAKMPKTTVTSDEAITIKMSIEGDGDPKIVQAPDFNIPQYLEKYAPSTLKDETFGYGQKIKMSKEFEYIFVPKKDTTFTIEPTFTYFDTNTKKYESLTSGAFTIHVVKGNGISSIHNKDKTEIELSQLSNDTSLYNTKGGFFGSAYYFMTLFGISASALFFYLIRILKEKKYKKLKDEEQKISNVALKCLQNAYQYKQVKDVEKFYEEIAKSTSGYIIQRYNIPNISADATLIVSKMQEQGINPELVSTFEDIQDQCQKARFAGVYGDTDSLYHKVAEWIDSIEQQESITT